MEASVGIWKDNWLNYGFVQYAATNNIIMIAPQAEISLFPDFNFEPCFWSNAIKPEEE
jgi:hypothetical protein